MTEDYAAKGRMHLAAMLHFIERNDTNYEERYSMVIMAVGSALQAGYPAGFRIDPDEPEWPVAYIELPTGQVSWHMPAHKYTWDGHDVPTKYERCRVYREQTNEELRLADLAKQGV